MMRKIRPRSRAVKKSEESQRVLDALDAYLEGNIDEPVRWLVRFWQDQAAVMLYRELRELVIGETDPESLFDIWFQDYSKMLSEKMTPVWEQAFLEGWKNNSLFCGAEDVISSESWVRSWIVDHTGDLITNCCNEQVSAIRYLIAEAESLNMSSAETARYLLCPKPSLRLKMMAALHQSLAKDEEIIMFDDSPMAVKALKMNNNADYLREGQMSLTGYYACLKDAFKQPGISGVTVNDLT